MLVTQTITEFASTHPDKIALVSDSACLSYGELNTRINRLCHTISANTHDRGTPNVIALLLGNSVELLEIFLAGAKIGWISAVMDPKWSPHELNSSVNDSRPAILVVDKAYYSRLNNIPRETLVVVAGEDLEGIDHDTAISYEAWIACNSEDEPHVTVSKSDLFYMGYTSGTTGRPKGFVRTHESWIESFKVGTREFSHQGDDRIFAPGPLSHSLSLYAGLYTLFLGGTFYFLHKFSPQQALDLIVKHSITHLYLVPTMFEAMYRSHLSKFEPPVCSSIRTVISSGDKWNPESRQKAQAVFPHAQLFEFYGASELSFVSVLNPEHSLKKPECVGKPVYNVRISIRDAAQYEVPPGTTGQLYVKSNMICSGYYGCQEEPGNEFMPGEWASVGDIAYQDDEGFIYLVGRKKNMLITGGLNIYPEEVERVLLSLPEIDAAIVAGVPDSYWGQRVVALVKVKKAAFIDNERILAFCREHLAPHKCPRNIIRVDSFPLTTSNKVARKQINEWLISLFRDKKV